MININTYINEKLVLNKDSKFDNDTIIENITEHVNTYLKAKHKKDYKISAIDFHKGFRLMILWGNKELVGNDLRDLFYQIGGEIKDNFNDVVKIASGYTDRDCRIVFDLKYEKDK